MILFTDNKILTATALLNVNSANIYPQGIRIIEYRNRECSWWEIVLFDVISKLIFQPLRIQYFFYVVLQNILGHSTESCVST